MSRIGICHACEIGDHKHHQGVVHAVSEGMYGGVICACKGECREEAPERRRRMLRRMGLTRFVGSRSKERSS